MARKTIEEQIREISTSELNYRLENDRENYSAEVLAIMNDELNQRNLKNANPIDQVKTIKQLSNDEIEYIVTQSKYNYPETIYKIILNEYKTRDVEKEQWIYLDSQNDPIGPVKYRNLKDLALSGKINKDTLIVKKDFDNWITAREISGLFDDENSMVQNSTTHQEQPDNQPATYRKPLYYYDKEDNLGCGLSLLSFIFPIAGFIMFVGYSGEKSKRAGQIALWGLIFDILLVIIYY